MYCLQIHYLTQIDCTKKYKCKALNVGYTLMKHSQTVTLISDKKLSYRRETARQLPTWREGEG